MLLENTVTVFYLRSGLGGVVKTSAEFDVVRKPRLGMLEMGICDRELLGCSSNLTRNMKKVDINEQFNK